MFANHFLVFVLTLIGILQVSLALDLADPLLNNTDKAAGRVFSLFSIVTFKNSACTSKTDSTMKGTCFTASECSTKGGTASGNCASGFGVCCTFTVSTCGSTVSQNCTYVQNPSYPSTYASVSVTCSYTVAPLQTDICQLRLDFTNFVTIVGTNGLCTDSFIVTTPTGTASNSICGTNTGLHMYMETASSTSSSTLAFTIGSTSSTRTWKIKVSQIECWNTAKAPADCRQYYTGVSGTFKSFNFAGGAFLAGQQYTSCFRQELGYCAMDYSESQTTSPDPFNLGPVATASNGAPACIVAGIIIPSDQWNTGTLCGTNLAAITAQTTSGTVRQLAQPFTVSVFGITPLGASFTGFNLNYYQVPCN